MVFGFSSSAKSTTTSNALDEPQRHNRLGASSTADGNSDNTTNPRTGENFVFVTSMSMVEEEISRRVSLSTTKTRVETAEKAMVNIRNDRINGRDAIAAYGINPVELLHMVERWTQQMLSEYKASEYRFKHILKDKWEKQELNANADLNSNLKKLCQHVRDLDKAARTSLSKASFDELKNFIDAINQDTNTNELKTKIDNTIDTFLQHIESLEFLEKHSGIGKDSGYLTTKNVLKSLKRLNRKPANTICIIGLEKCGKSTFINALLGFELLPSAVERCTQIRTLLKPPVEHDSTLFATVKFYNDDEFKLLINQMMKKSDEADEDFQKRKAEVLRQRQELISKYPEYEEAFHVDRNDHERDEVIKKLHKYIVDEVYVNIMKEIIIYTDRLPGKNYELLDVPGFDSPIKEHRDAALQSIKLSDAFLFLTDGGRPSLTRDQIRLLNEIQDGRQHYEAMKRAFGIITKLDQCHTKDQYEERLMKSKQELINKGFRAGHIFSVCSIMNLLDRNSTVYQTILSKIKDFNDLQNGFNRSKEALCDFIEYELPKTHINQLIDIGVNKLSRYANDALEDIKRSELARVNLSDERSFEEYIKQENNQKWDRIYHEEIFRPVFDEANIWQKSIFINGGAQFIDDTIKRFRHHFLDATEDFINRSVDMNDSIMKQYSYTALYSISEPFDNQLRDQLCFELESLVLNTSNYLAGYLYEEYIGTLERILNKIYPEGDGCLYRTQLLSYDICKYEVRALVLRLCRPIITAQLRFSHANEYCRSAAIDELIRLAPNLESRLRKGPEENEENSTQQNDTT